MAGMYGCFKGRNSDSAAMASRPPDLTNQEPAEVQEECSGKKKSKFQTFKKLFARKKRKEPSAGGVDDGLKASQSSDNVSKTSENTLTRSEKEKGSGSKISLGNKALSHDSIFVSDSSEANEALGASQDSIHGKVKSLQLQLKQAIRLGSPPSLMCVKGMEDAGTMSEDDGLPCSPPEYTTLHTVMNQAQRNSSNSLQRVDSDDDQLSCGASSRAVSPLVVPGDFSQPASPFGCLDNSAAKHKLGLRHKACNKRKPARQLEGKVERDSSVEENISVPGAEDIKEQEQQMAEDEADDELKPKVEREEEEDDKDEENGQPRDPTVSLLTDKEKREEGEDESEAEQDVSHDPDTSCPPMPGLSEEEASDDQPRSSSKLSSRSSSLDSLRATPEPPAGPREYLMDPPGASYGAEDNLIAERDSASEEDDLVQDISDEESSLLEEVLNSLKTPLTSCSVDVEPEGVVLEMDKEEERGVELVGDEDEVEEPVGYQLVPSDSILLDQTAEEEKEVKSPSLQEEEEVTAVGEEVKGRAEEMEDEEEVLIVERFTQHSDEEEGEQEEEDQPQNMLTRQSISQQAEEGEEEESEREEEEEPIELEKEPEVEEEKEGWEKREEADDDDDDDDDDDGEMAVEVHEEREVEDEEKMIPDSQDEEVQSTSWQEADEDEVFQDAFVYIKHTEDNNSTGNGNEVITSLQEGEENFTHEEEDGEKEGEEVDLIEQKSEEDVKEDQHDADQTEQDQDQDQDQDQESHEKVTFLDTKELQKDLREPAEQVVASSKPPPLSLPGSHHRTHSDDGAVSPPSRTSTLQISLVSPSSENTASLFQLSPVAADPSESITESPSPGSDSTEPNAAPEQEAAGTVEDEEEKQSNQKPEDPPSAAVGGAATQPTDQSKIRFTIAPAWQRSQSLSPPSSPPTHVSLSSGITKPTADEVGAAADGVRKAESVGPAKADDVLSPGSVRNAGIKAQVSAAASTAERSVVAEGNPDSPFGVRLRKTSALLRFSSEEENPEPPSESPSQPTGCKADSPQPISNKPALPKKPEGHVDAGGKPRRISDPAPGWGVSGGADPPSWISVAKQKQKVYKENSLDEITPIKEEQERKSSLPTYVSSAASSNKTAESASKVGQSEVSKPTLSVEKETKKTLSPPTPVPPQPLKSQPLPCPVAPKPQRPSATAKPPPQPDSPQRSLSPPAPVPVPSKSPPCTTPSYLSKTATSPKTPTVTSPPFSSRTILEKPGTRTPGVPGQAVSSQRGLPPPALPQDEPPWMALAKKKAKAWSEMPQIVQ